MQHIFAMRAPPGVGPGLAMASRRNGARANVEHGDQRPNRRQLMARGLLLPVVGLILVLRASVLFAEEVTTFTVTNNGFTSYLINGANNPSLNLVRGQTYVFQVNAIGHPFWIKTVPSLGTGDAYNDGVTNNGTQLGSVTFVVPANAPTSLFYNCQFHTDMTGQINISDPTPV